MSNDILAISKGVGRGLGGSATQAPTVTVLTSGSGTFTTPANVLWLRVRMVGGGGGGSAGFTSGGSSANYGGTGGTTSFTGTTGSTVLTANGGSGNTYSAVAGGTASIVGANGVAYQGTPGGGFFNNANIAGPNLTGGNGGNSPFGGAGSSSPGNPGQGGVANTGSGGGGGSASSASSGTDSGGGGAAGGYIDAIITSPVPSYTYSVGAAGTAGPTTGSSGGFAGGSGGSGVIIIEQYYSYYTSSTSIFTDSAFAVENASDTTRQLVTSLSGASTSTITTLAITSTANHTLTLPNFTDTLAVLAGAQTLTNKNLASTTNTFPVYAPNASTGTAGIISGTNGVLGFSDGSSAAAGYLGETFNTVTSGAGYLSSGAWNDATSFALTAGSWLLSHQGYFSAGGATYSNCKVGISTTSGNSATGLNMGDNLMVAGNNNGNGYDLSATVTQYRVNISSTTTYYAKYNAGYSGGSPSFYSRFTAVRIR